MNDDYVFWIAAGLICILTGASLIALDSWGCSSKADAMGFRHTYGPVKGCIVEYKPGKWIPLERYRAID